MSSEEQRHNEVYITELVRELATEVLVKFPATSNMITDHLPRVIAHLNLFCTFKPDSLLGIPSVTPHIMRVIVFTKLIPITDTAVKDLTQPFLQTVQCHALLWSLDILHGDISVTNLMIDPESKTGVLIDLDLTTVAYNDTIDACPLHGNNRTGTMVFIALDLMGRDEDEDGLEGKLPMLYRHDLESFCWVFLWICYCYDEGKCTLRYPFTDWIDTTPEYCRRARLDVRHDLRLANVGPSNSYAWYKDRLLQVVKYWVSFHINDMDCDPFEEPDEIQMLQSVLGLLPRSPKIEMQWAHTYTRISPTAK
ncbi:hypothetical protein QCA50_016763 [Cerrena zonata]|uniref:Fungal-type protein kinase domain-containing protein n=1 Tax=Cerrena zonata TaxID=2478898 RepID=A0AAW0FMN2_9APHY